MAKTKAQKASILDAYTQVVQDQDFIILNIDRVPAASLTSLRKTLATQGSHLYIVKNKLLGLALKQGNILGDFELKGNFALLSSKEDLGASLKALDDHKKAIKETLSLRGETPENLAKYVPYQGVAGYVQKQEITANAVSRLANLPAKPVLIAQLMSVFNAPLTGFMSVLNGNVRQVIYALKAIQEAKQTN